MLKAITFDFWNTLYPPLGDDRGISVAELRAEVLRDFLKEKGKNINMEQAHAAYERAEEFLFNHWRTDFRYSGPEKALEDIASSLELTLTEQDSVDLTERFRFRAEVMRIAAFDGVLEMLATLSERYRLGIISDTWLTPGALVREIMEKDDVLKYFPATVFSDETGFLKPHASQFQTAVETLGAMTEETLHVGDSERRDVGGAKALGMMAALVNWEGETSGSQADFVITDIQQLPEALAALADS